MLRSIKPSLYLTAYVLVGLSLSGCSVNPATGQSQFAALMSPAQEASIGAQEHEKILQQYGGTVKDAALNAYVERVGQRVAADTERPDVRYRFFLLDTPVVNAFALPGGYVYVTRGILALAETEAQLAAVLAHEVAHVTARHSAERYSHGVVSSLGAAVIAAALDSKTAAQAAGVGSQLYLASYSRRQESEADDLGIRYLHRAGYDTDAMAEFLRNLERFSAFEAQQAGSGSAPRFSYFSTHPQTTERAAQSRAIAASYPANAGETNRAQYMKAVDGMIFGDSADQGLVRGQTFWHPVMDFTFTAPDGFILTNGAREIVARDPSGGAVAIFDAAKINSGSGIDPATYLTRDWMKGEAVRNLETITIHGRRAATAEFTGTVNRQPMTIRLVAVAWDAETIFRFQIAIPQNAGASLQQGLQRMTYSLRNMSAAEKQSIRPHRIAVVTARPGDSVATLGGNNQQRFRAINGMNQGDTIIAGQQYKTVVE